MSIGKTGIACVVCLLSGAIGPQTIGQSERSHLLASDGGHFDQFGRVVGVHGDFAIAGAPAADGLVADAGAAYVFARNEGGPDNWGEVEKLFSSDGVAGNDFGYGVAIEGDVAVVGAPSIPVHGDGDGMGAAYIFVRDPKTGDWSEHSKLEPSGGVTDDAFGERVAIEDDTIFVAAPRADDRGTDAGAVYVFIKDLFVADEWGLHKKVLPEFGNASGQFGQAIDVDNDLLIVGTNNGGSTAKASIFGLNEGGTDNWGLIDEVTASDGESFEDFGRTVAIDGTTAVVGAWRGDGVVDSSGAAYLYEPDSGDPSDWVEMTKIFADDGLAGDNYGLGIAIEADTVCVGANKNNTPFADAGSVYIYNRNEGGPDNWGQVRNLVTCDNASGAEFGFSVDLDAGTLLVGAVDYVIIGVARTGRATVFDNAVPGSALTDCNNNGQDDACDILNGTSTDDDGNGVPDECEATIDTGMMATLNPTNGPGSPSNDPLMEITNVSGGAGETVSVSVTDTDLHPGESGFSVVGETLTVNTTMADGTFFMTITMPINAGTLGGAEWSTLDLMYFNTTIDAWELAAAGNTVNSPGHASPVGDRFVESSSDAFLTLDDLSTELGDYGVFWHTTNNVGFVWANVDHTTDYAAAFDTCPADVDDSDVVNVVDLLAVLAAWGPCPAPCPEDGDKNGAVDVVDLLAVLAAWGDCQ